MTTPVVHCRACGGAHERGPLYGCTGCDRVLCDATVRAEAVFHFVETRAGRAACGRLERLDVTNDLRRARPLDAVKAALAVTHAERGESNEVNTAPRGAREVGSA